MQTQYIRDFLDDMTLTLDTHGDNRVMVKFNITNVEVENSLRSVTSRESG